MSKDDFDYELKMVAALDLKYYLDQVHLFRGNVNFRTATSTKTCFGDIDPITNPCKLEVEGLDQ
jgi:hypothetical protein